MSEPLTKMAERMTKVPRSNGVESQLRARNTVSFLASQDAEPIKLHVAEPVKAEKWSEQARTEFSSLVSKILDVQGKQLEALASFQQVGTEASEALHLNLYPPQENAESLRSRLTDMFQNEDLTVQKAREAFWQGVRGKIPPARASFLQVSNVADVAKVMALAKSLKHTTAASSSGRDLEELLNMTGSPGAADAMRSSGVLQKSTQILKSESASDHEKGLAGSLITRLTNMPVSAETSDVATGGSGHVTIVLPSPQRIYGLGQ